MNNDPFEEIFALNLGDFLAEYLISDELAQKIKTKVQSEPQGVKKQLEELISIYSIDNTLNILGFKNQDEYIIYNAIAKTLTQIFEVSACHIFLSKEHVRGDIKKDLFLAGSSENINDENCNFDFGYNFDETNVIVEVFKNQKYLTKNFDETDFNYLHNKQEEKGIKQTDIFPVCNNQLCIGVIVFERNDEEEMPQHNQEVVYSIGALFATSMQVQNLMEEASVIIKEETPRLSILKHLRAELTVLIGDLGDAQQVFVEMLAQMVDKKNSKDNQHSVNTAKLSQKISDYLKLNEKTKDLIYYAALLQNIGKVIVPQEIFEKKEQLSKEEFAKLNNSPNVGVSILMKVNFLSEIIPYVNYYKERWDGKGTPEGLKGMSIPFGARIIGVADAYCALTEERPFRKSFDDSQAMEIIKQESGTKWDPTVVDVLNNIKRV